MLRVDPKLRILIIDEVIGADRLGQRAGGSQDTQRADQLAVLVKTALVVAALGVTLHGPVFPGGVNVPGADAHALGSLDAHLRAAPAAGHIQPPGVGDLGVAVLHPLLDGTVRQAAGTVVPGNGEVVGLMLLQINQEVLEAGGTRA